ncbi:MAG: hypothetical protein COU22_01520 [Candidatus Komeilibacteria bacterium CG10_big_fil_rev_8_21_14_0_10_41_13]|uniref:Uncharacterized protein n=1 Tax=Candidatus Komeilibacteria bacterium CG10_big_fil_rev_8_21_14_0_10_41_13 TaxID=1974476 RepID=A0A2M6WCQ0_9BACT|nr:MAG: hypothetical protein COU22_01520 [Candidatus Komeilibacteria bacterium CG10_big_fil_rev_8_21_14_0_10_41_13]
MGNSKWFILVLIISALLFGLGCSEDRVNENSTVQIGSDLPLRTGTDRPSHKPVNELKSYVQFCELYSKLDDGDLGRDTIILGDYKFYFVNPNESSSNRLHIYLVDGHNELLIYYIYSNVGQKLPIPEKKGNQLIIKLADEYKSQPLRFTFVCDDLKDDYRILQSGYDIGKEAQELKKFEVELDQSRLQARNDYLEFIKAWAMLPNGQLTIDGFAREFPGNFRLWMVAKSADRYGVFNVHVSFHYYGQGQPLPEINPGMSRNFWRYDAKKLPYPSKDGNSMAFPSNLQGDYVKLVFRASEKEGYNVEMTGLDQWGQFSYIVLKF